MIGFCDKNNMILFAYDSSDGEDEPVLTIAKRIDGVLTVVDTYYGEDAVLMYKQIKHMKEVIYGIYGTERPKLRMV